MITVLCADVCDDRACEIGKECETLRMNMNI